jgi:ubiquinone/menaquinone biosynthesis C-methylase UbiE
MFQPAGGRSNSREHSKSGRIERQMSSFTSEELQRKWDRAARWYDLGLSAVEHLGLRRLRRGLVRRASGRVLEVAAGTGLNLQLYEPGTRVIATDLSYEMLRLALKRSDSALAALMEGARLAFADGCFDTVVSTLATCTFPEPVAALGEMRRVCRPGGRILLLEHGLSDRKRIARWQHRHAPRHARHLGCFWNRNPLEIVSRAGIRIIDARRSIFGIVHVIEATP